jgi:hypothetical protein
VRDVKEGPEYLSGDLGDSPAAVRNATIVETDGNLPFLRRVFSAVRAEQGAEVTWPD